MHMTVARRVCRRERELERRRGREYERRSVT
jgi:hypothetical protein